jgi:hypothetical protein
MKPVRWLRFKLAGRLREQTCQDCYRDTRSAIWFYVANHVWWAVVGEDQPVLCLVCFDRRAERVGVDYRPWLTVLGARSWLVRFDP